MNLKTLAALVLIFSFVAAFFTWLFFAHKKRKRILKDSGIEPNEEIHRQVGNWKYWFELRERGNAGPMLTVAVRKESFGSFTVNKRSRFDGFFIRLGIVEQLRTGDMVFDQKFYISTDTEKGTSRVFSNEVSRESTYSIFEMGFNEVACTGHEVKALWHPFNIKEPLPADFTARAAEALNVQSKGRT